MQDLRYAVRLLRRSPLFTLTAALSVAIGIAATTTIFTLANALLLREPIGVLRPDRLVDIGVTRQGVGFGSSSYPNYLDIRERATTLDGVYAHPRFPEATSVAGAGGDLSVAFATQVSPNYFSVLGAVPAAGRLFGTADASESGASSVAVLSHRYWTRRFNRNLTIVGGVLRLNGQAFTVVGVAAEGFQGTGVRSPDLWVPLRANDRRGTSWLVIGGRLKPGASVSQAAAELDALGRALATEHPSDNKDIGLTARALSPVPGEAGPITAFLTLLMAIVMVVLVIACTNVSGMLLARAAMRRREVAVRLAIGGGRMRIVRQLMTETLLLFVIGALAGLLLALWMTSALASQLPALPFPIDLSLSLDTRVVVFAMIVSLLASLATGLAPAVQASKSDLIVDLTDELPRVFGRVRLRHAFVVGQVSLSVLLVVIAGLFVRALQEVSSNDPGFDSKGIELASIDFSLGGYTKATAPVIARELVDRVRRLPNVDAATIAAVLPGGFEGIGLGGLSVAGVAPPDGAPAFFPVWNTIEPGYFATLRMPLVAGRDFQPGDRPGTEPVVIIGEGAARTFWPGQSAVGRYVQSGSGRDGRNLLVIGVARDPKFGSFVDGTSGLYAYVPLQQQALQGWPLLVAARSTHGGRLTGEIRALISSVAPGLPIVSSQTADEYAALGLLPQRLAASVSGSLGVVGLLLAGFGIYGLTAYTVASRTREIGIRLALGAQRGHGPEAWGAAHGDRRGGRAGACRRRRPSDRRAAVRRPPDRSGDDRGDCRPFYRDWTDRLLRARAPCDAHRRHGGAQTRLGRS